VADQQERVDVGRCVAHDREKVLGRVVVDPLVESAGGEPIPVSSQVSRVRNVGETTTRSGAMSCDASQRPTAAASARPGDASRRSASDGPSRSALACRTSASRSGMPEA